MFVVLNKSKINSYIISFGTVAFLLVMGFYMNTHQNTVETGANEYINSKDEINMKENNIIIDS